MILPTEPTVSSRAAPLALDLIRKYSIPGPRYTSYPPATQFTADLPTVRLEDAIAEDNAPGAGPVSLYFHLPFCETRCWFCGCNTVITRRRDAAGEYLDDLAREVKLTAARMDRTRPVTQVHLGGGTPTFFPPDQLRRLGALLREYFQIAPDAEFSVEVDPRRLTEEHVVALHEIGANRASLGVQDTDSRVQLAIHRFQPHHLNQRAFEWMRGHGFESVNVDLIFGLPLQKAEGFSRTIEDVLALSPDRLSVFSYAHVPWIKPAQRIFDDRGQLPTAEEKLAMFALAHEKLTAAGFVDIGLDHFARPDDSLAVAQRSGTLHRNFQGYTTQAGASLYAFGISSISSTANTYRQNHKALLEWRASLTAGELPVERGLRLTEEDQRRRTIIMRLMCDRRLDYSVLSRLLGLDFAATYAADLGRLEDLREDGLIRFSPQGLEVTPVGIPLLRVIAMRFDPLFTAAPRRHAQAI
ncbi:MAG: oxygen-independent coproporphyrinogen III oxidase [Verrucomicrobia bacterium]|nr:oxygen-independent coproporphyrinogen III oxidase [Verrucomicrobiota bacterium]